MIFIFICLLRKVPLDKQIEIFSKLLEFANLKNKLVTVHCVYEWEKLYKIFEKARIENLTKNKILLHSFQGNAKIMQKFRKFNPWFSLSSGCFIEKNYEMIKEIPLDRLLLESDSPSMFNKNIYSDENEYSYYFVEESNDGEIINNINHINNPQKKYQNHPMSIIHLAKKIAELRKIDFEVLIENINENNKILIDNII